MTSIAKKNPYRQQYKFKTTYMSINQRMYYWADNLFFDLLISGSILHTLKAIIATRHLKEPTIQQINDARTRSASTKFAQADSVDNRTIRRHIKKLETLKYIIPNRQQDGWYRRNSYTICVPDEYLVAQRGDIMSSSLSCSSSLIERRRRTNIKNKIKKENSQTATAASPEPDGSAAALPTKSWQDELREQYEIKLITDLTPEEIKAKAKNQLQALKIMLRK